MKPAPAKLAFSAVHPGRILKEEFLAGLGLSQNQLADALQVPHNRIHDIVRGKRSITADTDLRLSRLLGLAEGYFLKLQNEFDLMEARRKAGLSLAKIKPLAAPAQAAPQPEKKRLFASIRPL